MAKIIIECNPCDQGHYGHTNYKCSECDKDCEVDNEDELDHCPNCGVIFDEESEIKISDGFGGHDFI